MANMMQRLRRTRDRFNAIEFNRMPYHEKVDWLEFEAKLAALTYGRDSDHVRRAAHRMVALNTRLQVEAEMAGWQPVDHHDYRMTEQVEYRDDDMHDQPLFGGPSAHSNGVLEYLDWFYDGEYEHHPA